MKTGEILKPAVGLSAATALFSLANTAIRDHRLYTHRSVNYTHSGLDKTARIMGGHLTDSKRWAAVHRVHHSTPDANLVPFVELADYIDHRNRPLAHIEDHPEIPDEVHGLDPAVESIDTDVAYEIGSLARELVAGLYQRQQHYTPEEGDRILHSTEPRYYYESKAEMKRDRKNPVRYDPHNLPSLQQIRFLLRDPHSPALHRKGIPGVLVDNVPNYSYAESNFEDPAFRPKDLQPDQTDEWIRDNRSLLRYGYVGGMALAGMALSRPKSAKEAAVGAASGMTASGLAVVALIGGGNLTNGLGHAGDIDKLTVREALNGKVYPKADGTYTTDDKRLSPLTLDEVGGQRIHHDHPYKIAYSLQEGIEKLKDAPFGKFVEFLVRHNVILKAGDNFQDEEHRPDMPSEAVTKLQEYRASKLATQSSIAQAA